MIQEFRTILSRQNSSCMARYWMQVCCESRVYDDCGSGGQEMCLLMLQTVATETNVCGSGAAVIELSTRLREISHCQEKVRLKHLPVVLKQRIYEDKMDVKMGSVKFRKYPLTALAVPIQ